jgi:hypothetical protein
MTTNQMLLQSAYNAFNSRDIDAVLAVMHPDVNWPNGMDGGRVHGYQSVRDYWVHQFSLIDSHVEPLRFETDEVGRTVVYVRQVVRDLDGNVIAYNKVKHIFSIEKGLVKRMDIE